MSQIANMTIADGATTPVNHTFVPVGANPPSWEDSDAAKPYKAAQYRITSTTKRSSSTKGMTRVRFVVELPTMGNGVSLPASEVDYTHTFIGELICPNRGLKQERKDTRVIVRNMFADAQLVDIIDELRNAY